MTRPLYLLGPIAALALTACTAAGQPSRAAPPSPCSPEGAKGLAGQIGQSDAEVMRATGASVVRRLSPGSPMTMDYRRERVMIEVDGHGKVLRAFCG
ncbi:I78 family peptidase inhibitor [Bosea sp. LC85]|uniref:I78 family peptidase inhibitor n=1 Tax=Bosea sp. LC85 TaxID=1502851 RepID=UPI0009DE2572|nr:I78 family peptidase inhibitor [Bosea sp. LC85]